MYEKLRGTVLPPAAALERIMGQLGVSPKQTERARQVFQKSAAHASFIDPSTGRFIKPANVAVLSAKSTLSEKSVEQYGGGGGGGGLDSELKLDPLLIELLRKIPPKGEDWGAAKRIRWFRTFAMNVSQIYDSDEQVIELKIEQAPSP